MKRKIRYQAKTDLKLLRRINGISKEYVADKIGYTIRSLERMEKENAVTTERTAHQLCSLYDLVYEEQFFIVDKKSLECCNLLEYLTQRDIQTKNSGVNVRYRGKHRFFKGFNEFIKEKTRRCDNDFEKIERHVFFLMELSTILWIIKRTTAWKHWFLAICERLSFSKYLIDWL